MHDADCNLLRRMAIFGGLSDATLKMILDQSQTIQVSTGDFFFREGDRPKSFFVLTSGTVTVERKWRDTAVVLDDLEHGDCIGEMSLIDMMPRSASIRAVEDCRALEIPVTALHSVYRLDVEQYAMIMMNMGREVSRRLRATSDRLFELEREQAEKEGV